MNNIKKIYQHAGKCDDQKNLKDILEASILSTPEGFTYNSPNVHMPSTPVKKPSARKSLCLFTNILYVQPKTAKHRFVAAKYRPKAMKVGNILFVFFPKGYYPLSWIYVRILQQQNDVFLFCV